MEKQSYYLKRLNQKAEELLTKARQEYQNITDAELNFKPNAKKWSIAELFEHIINSNKDYLNSIDKGIKTGSLLNGEDPNFRHTILGIWMINILGPDSKKSYPTPKLFRPVSGTHSRSIIQDFINQHERITDYLKKAGDIKISQLRIVSPVSKLLRFNFGDAFGILIDHTERHFNEIDRLLDQQRESGLKN